MENIFPSILKYRASTHPERTAYVLENKQVSYHQYYTEALQISFYLSSLGLKKGDRIGILDLNSAQAVNLISGAMLMGVIPVSLNWRSMPIEISFVVADAGIVHFFYGAMFGKSIAATQFDGTTQLHEIEKLSELPNKNNNSNVEPTITFEDTCVILYTSGTTGNPKGVMLSYKNVFTCYMLCTADTPSFGPDTRNLVCGPLYSIFGFGAFFSIIYAGGTNILIRMFEPNLVLKTMVNEKVSNALLVPIMIRTIISLEEVEDMDFSSLKHVQYGGSPISPDVLVKASKIFNCYFTQVYGLTESTGVASSLRYDDHSKILTGQEIENNHLLMSAGKVGIGIDLKILNQEGNIATTKDPGEIYIKGNNIAKGYWNRKEETAEQFLPDGWFKTGDMGYLNEDGFLFLVDRKNDMIVSKGMNIFPAEVEKILEQHPSIKEVAVVSIPDESFGEAVCAVVVLKEGDLTLVELRKWCTGKLAEHKFPLKLEIRTELPRNPTGKVLRRLIKESFWKNENRNIKG